MDPGDRMEVWAQSCLEEGTVREPRTLGLLCGALCPNADDMECALPSLGIWGSGRPGPPSIG